MVFKEKIKKVYYNNNFDQKYPLRSVSICPYDSLNSFNLVRMNTSNLVGQCSLGTGFGEDKKFNTTNVEFEKQENPNWIAVINYDTISNLRKRGIIIDNNEKNAFPGYKDIGCHIPKNRV